MRLFWSKTVRRTQKQEATEKSSVCLSASEFAELPSTPGFASRAEILSQIQLCRRLYHIISKTLFACFAVRYPPSKVINSGIAKRENKRGRFQRTSPFYFRRCLAVCFDVLFSQFVQRLPQLRNGLCIERILVQICAVNQR